MTCVHNVKMLRGHPCLFSVTEQFFGSYNNFRTPALPAPPLAFYRAPLEPKIGLQTQRSLKHIITAAARHRAAAPCRLRRARPRRLQAGFRAEVGQTSESPGSAGFHGQLSIMATSQPHRKPGKGQRRDDIRGSTLAPHTHCSQATHAQRIPRG